MGQLIGMCGLFGFVVCVIMTVNNKKNKKTAKPFEIAALAFFAMLILGLIIDSNHKDKDSESNTGINKADNEVTSQIGENTEVNSTSPTESLKSAEKDELTTTTEVLTTEEIIYELNEGINKYILDYNRANPDEPITKEMAKPYHHHGSDHENQIKYNINDFEVVITGGSEVYIGYTPDVRHSNDDYKEMYIKYLRGFNLGLSDDEIENNWNTVMEDLTHTVRFDKYEASVYVDTQGNISYFTIELVISY